MGRKATDPVSPFTFQVNCMMELKRLGLEPGRWQKFKGDDPGERKKRIRLRGKKRNGQHRGHRCSATSRGSNKRKG